MACDHKVFSAAVDVNRMTDIGRFIADVRIRCEECGLPFSFLGLPAGLSYERPMVSVDATELHAPIEPGPQPIGASGSARFEMPARKAGN